MSYKELCEKVGVDKVSVTNYCDESCSACGGYGEKIGVESCKEVLVYPPFTAEKREELEEYLIKNICQQTFRWARTDIGCEIWFITVHGFTGKGKTRSDALCSLLLQLIEKELINPEDIKRILE